MIIIIIIIIIVIIIIIKGVTPAGSPQRYYIAGGVRRRGKTGKYGKVRVKREG